MTTPTTTTLTARSRIHHMSNAANYQRISHFETTSNPWLIMPSQMRGTPSPLQLERAGLRKTISVSHPPETRRFRFLPYECGITILPIT